MTDLQSTTLELSRALSGQDLWAAIEAAQYARLIDHDVPATDIEARWIEDLIRLFSDSAEEWEDLSSSDQALVLERLGSHVEVLREFDLAVYTTVTRGSFEAEDGETVQLPLAVLTITRDDGPSVTIGLPEGAGIT